MNVSFLIYLYCSLVFGLFKKKKIYFIYLVDNFDLTKSCHTSEMDYITIIVNVCNRFPRPTRRYSY